MSAVWDFVGQGVKHTYRTLDVVVIHGVGSDTLAGQDLMEKDE